MAYPKKSMWNMVMDEMEEQAYQAFAQLVPAFCEGFVESLLESNTNKVNKNVDDSNNPKYISSWHQLLLPLTKEENDNFFKQLVIADCGIQISEYKQRVSNEAVHRLKFAYLNSSQFINIQNIYVDDVGLTIKLNSKEEYLYEWDILRSFQIREENNYLTINTNLFRLATTIEAQCMGWLLYSFYIIYSTRASILSGGIMPDILTSVPDWAITKFKTMGMEENICKLMGKNGLPSKQFIENCINFRNAYLYPINSLKK